MLPVSQQVHDRRSYQECMMDRGRSLAVMLLTFAPYIYAQCAVMRTSMRAVGNALKLVGPALQQR